MDLFPSNWLIGWAYHIGPYFFGPGYVFSIYVLLTLKSDYSLLMADEDDQKFFSLDLSNRGINL